MNKYKVQIKIIIIIIILLMGNWIYLKYSNDRPKETIISDINYEDKIFFEDLFKIKFRKDVKLTSASQNFYGYYPSDGSSIELSMSCSKKSFEVMSNNYKESESIQCLFEDYNKDTGTNNIKLIYRNGKLKTLEFIGPFKRGGTYRERKKRYLLKVLIVNVCILIICILLFRKELILKINNKHIK